MINNPETSPQSQSADTPETVPYLRPQDEIKKLQDKSEAVVRVVTHGKDVPLYWKRGQGYYWSFLEGKNGTITGDLDDLERKKSPNYVPGVIFHESRHVAISQPKRFKEEDWAKMGFAVGYNWFEDNRIEYKPDEHMSEGEVLVADHLAEDTAEGGGLDFKQGSRDGVTGKIKEKMGYIPKHMIFGAAARQFFYYREFTNELDSKEQVDAFVQDLKDFNSEVGEAFERILPSIDKYYKAAPLGGASIADIDQKAEQATKIYEDEIWPEFEKLVEKGREDETLKQFIDELIKGGKFQTDGNGNSFVMIDFDSLPPEIQQEIQKAMEGQKGQGQPSEAGEGEGSQPGQSTGESQPGQAQGQPGGKGGQGGQSEDGQQEPQVPFDKLSPEAQEAVKEQFDKLGEKDQQKMKDKADQKMGEVEDAVNKDLQGHTDKEGTTRPTDLEKQAEEQSNEHQDGQDGESGEGEPGEGEAGQGQPKDGKKENKEAEESQDGQKAESESSEGESEKEQAPQNQEQKPVDPKELEGVSKKVDEQVKNAVKESRTKETSKYAGAAKEKHLADAIKVLVDTFQPIFRPDIFPNEEYSDEGDEFDVEKLFEDKMGQVESAPFVVENEPLHKSYRFEILVDISSSMYGEQIEKVFELIVVLTEVFTKLGLDFEIAGYPYNGPDGTITKIYKGFDDTTRDMFEVPESVKGALANIVEDVNDSTPTSEALTEALEHIVKRDREKADSKAKNNFLLLLTDGGPNEGVAAAKAHIEVLEKWTEENDIGVIFSGFGIGAGTEFINDMLRSFPDKLRERMASKLTGLAIRKQMDKGKLGKPKTYAAKDVDKHFEHISQLVEVLPDIIEWMLDHPEEFRPPDKE